MRNSDIGGIVREFATNVMVELNYANEAFNARRLQTQMAGIEGIRVPEIYGALSSPKVLTMEFIDGVKISNGAAMDEAGLDREALARTFLDAMVKQIILDGFFHSDPHPGNVLVDLQSGDIIFLDMGMMGELTTQQRLNLVELLWAILQQDAHSLAQVVMRLSSRFREVDEAAFQRTMARMVDRYMIYAEATDSLSAVMSATMDAMYQHGLRFDSSLTLALKTLAQAEEIVYALDRRVDLVSVAFDAVKKLMLEQVSFENAKELLTKEASRTVREVVQRIPSLQQATMGWLDQYEKGRFVIELNTGDLNRRVDKLNRGVEWLTIALLLGGMMGGSAIAVSIPTSIGSVPLSVVAFFAFMASIVISAVLVVRLMWQR